MAAKFLFIGGPLDGRWHIANGRTPEVTTVAHHYPLDAGPGWISNPFPWFTQHVYVPRCFKLHEQLHTVYLHDSIDGNNVPPCITNKTIDLLLKEQRKEQRMITKEERKRYHYSEDVPPKSPLQRFIKLLHDFGLLQGHARDPAHDEYSLIATPNDDEAVVCVRLGSGVEDAEDISEGIIAEFCFDAYGNYCNHFIANA